MSNTPKLIWHALRDRRLAAISRRMAFTPEDALIVFSSSRGGSTWLTEIISRVTGIATIWEPMQPGSTAAFDRIGFGWNQYIPIDADWPEAKAAFATMLSGQTLSWPSTFYQRQIGTLRDYLEAERLLVKFVVAHGVAPWLCSEFRFKKRPLMTLRHPMATIASRLRHGAWATLEDNFVFPEARYPELNDQFRPYLEALQGRHRVHAAKWCMQHLAALRAIQTGQIEIHTVFYEDVLLNREQTLGRIFEVWELPVPSNLINLSANRSITSRQDSPIEAQQQVSHWRHSFSDREIFEMQEVLDHFGIVVYNANLDIPACRTRMLSAL
ncbi:sulfotransferase domain-containing protein [Mameliella alba]|uniref:sulfotransferase domain-containing protein n=1 Tax=Mameliella alba TaxID=561184 RepID=UPI000B52CDDC|nr:sulfotransferase domain-containing protein [Mameliella alba]OWV39226.1 hypothetical protein CDZ95_27310 [Mameliella alba]